LSGEKSFAGILSLALGAGAFFRVISSIPSSRIIARIGAIDSCKISIVVYIVCLFVSIQAMRGLLSRLTFIPIEAALGFALALFSLARQTLTKNLVVDDRDIDASAGFNRGLYYVARLILPLSGGLILVVAPPMMCNIFCLLLAAAAATILFFNRQTYNSMIGRHYGNTRPSIKEEVFVAVNFFKSDKDVCISICLSIICNFVLAPLRVVIPWVIHGQLKMSSGELGLSDACLGAGAILGSLCFARYRYISFAFGSIVAALAFSAMAIDMMFATSAQYMIFNAALILIGFSVSICGSKADSLCMKRTPKSLYTQISSLQNLVVGFSFSIGILLSGAFMQNLRGIVVVIMSCVLLCVIGASLPRVEDRS
jgi:predicted MFS family arabinose efflux permease